MKKPKTLVSLVLAALLICGAAMLASCDGGTTDPTDETTPVVTTQAPEPDGETTPSDGETTTDPEETGVTTPEETTTEATTTDVDGGLWSPEV